AFADIIRIDLLGNLEHESGIFRDISALAREVEKGDTSYEYIRNQLDTILTTAESMGYLNADAIKNERGETAVSVLRDLASQLTRTGLEGGRAALAEKLSQLGSTEKGSFSSRLIEVYGLKGGERQQAAYR